MKHYLLIILTCLYFAGCQTAGQRLQKVTKIEQKIEERQIVMNKHSKAYIDGVVRSLARIPVDKRIPEVKLALRLAQNTQTLLGQPEPDLAIDTDKLLSTNLTDQRFEEERLLQLEVGGKKALEDKLKLEREREVLNRQIQSDLAKRVEQERQSFWGKVKFWGSMLLGGGLLFVVCMYCPPVILFIKRAFTTVLSFIFKR